MLGNSKLDDKDALWKWTLKHLITEEVFGGTYFRENLALIVNGTESHGKNLLS